MNTQKQPIGYRLETRFAEKGRAQASKPRSRPGLSPVGASAGRRPAARFIATTVAQLVLILHARQKMAWDSSPVGQDILERGQESLDIPALDGQTRVEAQNAGTRTPTRDETSPHEFPVNP
jgi:hypothetical protein